MTEADRSRKSGVVLEKTYRFLLWLIPAVEKFPRSQKFLLGDRMQTLALDVQESLIEATYSRNPTPHLLACNLRLEKLRFLFRLAMDLRNPDVNRHESWIEPAMPTRIARVPAASPSGNLRLRAARASARA